MSNGNKHDLVNTSVEIINRIIYMIVLYYYPYNFIIPLTNNNTNIQKALSISIAFLIFIKRYFLAVISSPIKFLDLLISINRS